MAYSDYKYKICSCRCKIEDLCERWITVNTSRKLIGAGAISKIYEEDGMAYKTFSDEYPLSWVEYEVNVQQEILKNTQLLVPKMELIKESKEIKMDYIDGYTIGDRMRKEKYKHALDDLIDIQLSIHNYNNLKLSQAHDEFEKQIKESRLDEDLKNIGFSLLSKIEKKHILCHFDIHFLNIMYDHNDYYIIDWINAKLGNPVLDIARTYIILKQYAQRLANKYLKAIVKKGNYVMADVETAIPLMAILRLTEHDATDFEAKLLEMIHNN